MARSSINTTMKYCHQKLHKNMITVGKEILPLLRAFEKHSEVAQGQSIDQINSGYENESPYYPDWKWHFPKD